MGNRYVIIGFAFLLAVFGCEKEVNLDDRITIIQGDSDAADIAKMNGWIYSRMKDVYFWSDELKDSLEYDYSLAPDKFFASLKVAADRFSYSEPNSSYSGGTKGVNLNDSVKLDSIYSIGGKRIGYFYYTGFDTEADVTDVILKMKGVDELIIDVRSNPGGYVHTCTYLASLLVPTSCLGKLFYSASYNSRLGEFYKSTTGSERTYTYLLDNTLVRNRSLCLKRLWILAGSGSASCSELLVNSLRPYMQVIAIGETTVGKDVGMSPLENSRCKYRFWPITFRNYNAHGNPVPMTGLVPDYPVGDTAPAMLGDIR